MYCEKCRRCSLCGRLEAEHGCPPQPAPYIPYPYYPFWYGGGSTAAPQPQIVWGTTGITDGAGSAVKIG